MSMETLNIIGRKCERVRGLMVPLDPARRARVRSILRSGQRTAEEIRICVEN